MSKRERYHHGDLRRALVQAALDIAREQDADRISLREASRRADVSHAAAYRHFTDREALLVAASAEALAGLARAMEDELALASGSREALRAVGRAYVTYAIDEPGLFRLAFNHHPPAGPEREAARGRTGRDPGELLSDALDRLHHDGLLEPERRAGAQALAWSAVHGLASLILDGPLSEMNPTARLEMLESLLRSIEAGIVPSSATQSR